MYWTPLESSQSSENRKPDDWKSSHLEFVQDGNSVVVVKEKSTIQDEKGKVNQAIESLSFEDENSCVIVNFFPAVKSTNEKRKADDAIVRVNEKDDNSVIFMGRSPVQLDLARRGKVKQNARKPTNGESPIRQYDHQILPNIPASSYKSSCIIVIE